jgi:phosphatidylserine/phosphatidylglycerophosphate/cardiolipin synthase-like enzyme
MSDTAVVYAECLRLEVRVNLGLPSDVSNLEHFVIRAVHAGANTVPSLAVTLGVSPRILVDCLGDLWRQGHLQLDIEDPREPVTLSSTMAELVEGGKLETLKSTYQTTESRVVLLDTLTGRVMPESASRAARVPRLRVPRRSSDYTRHDVTSTALIRALSDDARNRANREGMRDGTPRSSPLRVLNAYLTPEFISVTTGTRTVPVVVNVTADEEGGLTVEVIDPQLSEPERSRATRRLQEVVDDQPDSAFAAALAEQLSLTPSVDVPEVSVVVAELQERCDALADSLPGTRQQAQDRVATALEALKSRIRVARERAAQMRVVVDGDHDAAVDELIRSARHQLVIAVPRINEGGLNRITPAIEHALGRGVQVVILWGLGMDAELPEAVINGLDNLQRTAGPERRLLVKSRVSARLHAKVVVADDRRCLVTSRNFLTGGDLGDVGLLLEGVGRAPCSAALELLEWVYQAFPDHDMARAILRHPTAFGSEVTHEDVQATGPAFSDVFEREPVGGSRIALWAGQWRRAADQLADATKDLTPTASLVRDAEHRRSLVRAVGAATWRLVIASDQLSATILDADLRERLAAAVDRGVDVTLVHGRLATQDAGAAQSAVQVLRSKVPDSRSGGTGSLTVVHMARNHAKGLVVDDEAVVGSFNMLSFPGHYRGRGRRQDRGEISVLIDDPVICDRVAAAWGASPKKRPTNFSRADHQPDTTTHSAREHLDKAAEILDVLLGGEAVGPALLELLAGGDRDIPVVDALAESGADVSVANPWWRWMVEQRWRSGDFAAACAMRPVVDDPGFRPRELLTTATLTWTAGAGGAVLTEQVLRDDLTGDEQRVLCLLGVAILLEHGDYAAREALSVLAPREASALAELRTIATELYDATGSPLPVTDLADVARQRAGIASSIDHWESLDGALARIRSHNTGFLSGAATIREAFRQGNELHSLQEITDRRDAEALASWFAEFGAADAGELVDRLSTRASANLIMGARRTPFVTRMESVLSAARDLALNVGGESAAQVRDPHVIRAVAAFARLKMPLLEEAGSLDEPERDVALAVARRIGEMMGEAYS